MGTLVYLLNVFVRFYNKLFFNGSAHGYSFNALGNPIVQYSLADILLTSLALISVVVLLYFSFKLFWAFIKVLFD